MSRRRPAPGEPTQPRDEDPAISLFDDPDEIAAADDEDEDDDMLREPACAYDDSDEPVAREDGHAYRVVDADDFE